jgi:hypothetical protein
MSGPTLPPQTIRQQLLATGNANPFAGAYSGDLMLAAEQRIGLLETDMATAIVELDRLADTICDLSLNLEAAKTGGPADTGHQSGFVRPRP